MTPRKPIEVHLAEGTFRPSRHGAGVPVVVGGRTKPKAPKGAAKDIAAAFSEITTAAARILDAADASMVEGAAVMLTRARAAAADIATRGILVENRFGAMVPNPAVRIERDALGEFRLVAQQLGIGPASRARLSGLAVEGKQVDEEFDELAEFRERRTGRAPRKGA